MPDRQAKLQYIRKDPPNPEKTFDSFQDLLQKALLLALLERGRLNDGQYRLAEEKLNRQRQNRARKRLEGGEMP